jgi:purine-binding chemotaxis protein CheW
MQLATFHLDHMFLGVDVMAVQEVLSWQAMTPVPLAPPIIGGLINLRGEIFTVVDLRRRFCLPPRANASGAMNVVLYHSPISLLVDRVGDVVEVSQRDLAQPPESVSAVALELINGVYQSDNQLLLVIDPERAIAIEEEPQVEIRQ